MKRLNARIVKNLTLILLISATGLLLADTPESAKASEFQDLQQIQNIAETFVLQSTMTSSSIKLTASAQQLDPRLRLKSCQHEPQPEITQPGNNPSMASVKVSCMGPSPWQLYVPVRIKRLETVVTLQTHLPRNTVVERDMLAYAEKEILPDSNNWFRSIEQVIGKSSRRAVTAGSVLKTSDLKQTQIIKRGQSLRLISRHGSIEVSTQGKALANAAVGNRLKVVNSKTGKKLEGLVIDSESVLIN